MESFVVDVLQIKDQLIHRTSGKSCQALQYTTTKSVAHWITSVVPNYDASDHNLWLFYAVEHKAAKIAFNVVFLLLEFLPESQSCTD